MEAIKRLKTIFNIIKDDEKAILLVKQVIQDIERYIAIINRMESFKIYSFRMEKKRISRKI